MWLVPVDRIGRDRASVAAMQLILLMAKELFPLGTVLQERRQVNLVTDAEVIASYPDGSQRTQHAEMLIREAMVLRALGKIDEDTEYRVFSILAFVMPEPDGTPTEL